MNSASLYNDLAADLTVGKLCEPLGRDVDGSESAQALLKELDRGPSARGDLAVHLVRENGKLEGALFYSDLLNWLIENYREHGNEPQGLRFARAFARPVSSSRIAASNTPFSRAVHFFATDETPYFVLDGDQIVGIFQSTDIFQPRANFCYLALVLDLETAALNLCTWFTEAWNPYWESLSDDRRSKVLKSCLKKFEKLREDDWADIIDGSQEGKIEAFRWFIRDLMQATNYIDKGKIIREAKLLLDQDDDQIEKVFYRGERVRNACAHPLATDEGHPDRWVAEPSDFFQMTPAKMSQFVRDCLEMIASIKTVMPRDA